MATTIGANELDPPVDDALVTLERAVTWGFVGDYALAKIPLDLCFDEPPFDAGVTQHIHSNHVRFDSTRCSHDIVLDAGDLSSINNLVYDDAFGTSSDDWACQEPQDPWTPWSIDKTPISPCSPSRPPVSIAERCFLNRTLWFSICRDLGQGVRGLRDDHHKYEGYCSEFAPGECCKIILDLGFEDLAVRRDIQETHSLVCDLHLTSQSPPGDGTRPPCIDIASLDRFVLEVMWRSSCLSRTKDEMLSEGHSSMETPCERNQRSEILAKAEKEKQVLFAAEQDLFSKIQITLGYYSLLRNVDLVWTAETTRHDLADARFAMAELVYLLAFRINMLFIEISAIFPVLNGENFVEMHSSLHDGAPNTQIRPVVFRYAAEILVRGLEAIGRPAWDLRDEDAQSPLRQLERDLSESFLFMVNHLRAYECRLSGWYNRALRTPSMPGLLAFVRATEKGLPDHLIVAVQRHVPLYSKRSVSFFDPFPLLQTQWNRYSTFDLFTHTPAELAAAVLGGSTRRGQRVPEYLITEHNSRFKLSKFRFEPHDDGACTNSSTGCPGTTTHRDFYLCGHPDPPRFCGTDFSVVALAGVHHERNADSPNDPDAMPMDFVPPKTWQAEFRDAQAPPDATLQIRWDLVQPVGPVLHKRKEGDISVDGDSASESDLPSRRRKWLCPNTRSFQALLLGGYGDGANFTIT
ncbi:hypothetical protein PV04_10400 [Phialophora macrospora]|uniref:Uncharacterized protein n=1 Tax=Phialophora macrospora TaxID=1851006 RepID=A0A0D2F2N5_9EURO|nr:hypothetical protein PV04_10400 [Phialophora macrospora]